MKELDRSYRQYEELNETEKDLGELLDGLRSREEVEAKQKVEIEGFISYLEPFLNLNDEKPLPVRLWLAEAPDGTERKTRRSGQQAAGEIVWLLENRDARIMSVDDSLLDYRLELRVEDVEELEVDNLEVVYSSSDRMNNNYGYRGGPNISNNRPV